MHKGRKEGRKEYLSPGAESWFQLHSVSLSMATFSAFLKDGYYWPTFCSVHNPSMSLDTHNCIYIHLHTLSFPDWILDQNLEINVFSPAPLICSEKWILSTRALNLVRTGDGWNQSQHLERSRALWSRLIASWFAHLLISPPR